MDKIMALMPKVKELEWIQGSTISWFCEPYMGIIYTASNQCSKYVCYHNNNHIETVDTLEQAKAACQSHFNALIMSCLVSAPEFKHPKING